MNVYIKRTVQAILANLGLRKFLPLGRSVCGNVPQPPLFFSSRSLPQDRILIAGRCQARYSVHHSETSCKGLSSDLPRTHSSSFSSTLPPTGACLCCTQDASNHIPPAHGLNFDAQPHLSNGLLPSLSNSRPLGRRIDGGKSCTLHQRGSQHPLTKAQDCGERGKGGGGGRMVGVLGLPTPLRGLSSNRRRRSSHSAQGCMRRPLERFCPAGDHLDGRFLTHL